MEYAQRLEPESIKKICQYYRNSVSHDSHGPSRFIQLLQLAWVGSAWRRHVLPHVYECAYLKIAEREDEPGWLTNIDLIVSLKLSLIVRELDIKVSLVDGIASAPKALNSVGFNSVYWPMVTTLKISDESFGTKAAEPKSTTAEDDTEAEKLKRYFVNFLPNLQYITISLDNDNTINHPFVNKISRTYNKQLYVLNTGDRIPIAFDQRCLGENISHLTLKLNSDTTSRLPRIYAAPLRYLALYDIPELFTWSAFYYDTSLNKVVYENLQELHLSFKSEMISEHMRKWLSTNHDEGLTTTHATGSITSREWQSGKGSMMPLNTEEQIANVIRRDANSRQLCFPKLQVLVLGRNPYSDKSFYTVFEESPLKNFIAKGSLKSMMNISQAMLSDLSTFVLDIAPTEESEDGKISYVQEFSANQHKELLQFTNKIFCSNTAIETAKLTLKDYTFPLGLSGYMEWPDLKELELHANVCLSSIMMIADQSPLLSKLEVTCITIDIHDIDRALNDLKHHGSAQDLRVSSKLEHLRVFYAKENEVDNTFKAIAYITRKLGSLKEVGSPKQVMRRLEYYLPQHLPKPPFLSEVGV